MSAHGRIPGEDDEPLPLDVDLSALEEAFARARQDRSIPDGSYRARVLRVELTRAQTSARPLIKWTLRILGPTRSGRHLWRNLVLSPETQPWLLRDLDLCGLRIDCLADLPPRLGELAGLELDVRVRTHNRYLDVYFVRAHRPPPAGSRPAT